MGDHALVVVAVRSTLRVEDVRELLEDLKAFPNLPLYRIYRGYRLFGAVAAALTMDEQADRYVYRGGGKFLTARVLDSPKRLQPTELHSGPIYPLPVKNYHYPYRQGLFVLTMGREGLVTIRNDDKFRPRDFVAGPGAH